MHMWCGDQPPSLYVPVVCLGREQMTASPVGTPETAAPEVLRGDAYGANSEVWSLFVVLYQICFGTVPYQVPWLICWFWLPFQMLASLPFSYLHLLSKWNDPSLPPPPPHFPFSFLSPADRRPKSARVVSASATDTQRDTI